MPSKNRPVSSGMTQRRTLFLGVLVAFIFGLYLGHMLPGLLNPAQPKHTEQTHQDNSELRQLQQAVTNNPNSVEAWNRLGHWYFDHESPVEAIKAYESSLRLKADDPDIITDLGIMYRSLGRYEQSLDLFRKASGLDPKHEQSRFNQGIVLYFDLDRKAEALETWKDLLRQNPQYKGPKGQSLTDWIRELS